MFHGFIDVHFTNAFYYCCTCDQSRLIKPWKDAVKPGISLAIIDVTDRLIYVTEKRLQEIFTRFLDETLSMMQANKSACC